MGKMWREKTLVEKNKEAEKTRFSRYRERQLTVGDEKKNEEKRRH